jgi:sugar/nucleoside kinase (ribokinase family)
VSIPPKRKTTDEKKQNKRPTYANIARYIAIGTELGMSVSFMTIVGYISFKKFLGDEFAAIGVVVGVVLGFFLGVYSLYKLFKEERW